MNRTMKIVSSVIVVAAALSGGYFYGRRAGVSPTVSKAQKQTAEYTCPMHPFIEKEHAGTCAICNMELVKKGVGVGINDKELQNVRHVALSPTQQVMANLATVAAVVKPFSREISCSGIVAYNQERQGKVSAWLAGRIDHLLVKSVGSEVHKGKPVAEIYSADLYNAQVQYLMAYKTIKILNNTVSVTFPINTHMALGDASERLRQLGFREEQFEQLQKADKPTIHIPLHSPFSGVVTETFVREGQYVNVGDPLLAIADLSRIWVELEVFEIDFPMVKVGQEVVIISPAYPGEYFHGKIKFIYPFLDAKTRTIKLRVELPNPGQKLKPEMYVQGNIRVRLSDSLVIPTGGVIDTGTRQVVWIETKPGLFVPRDVKTGARSGRDIQILSGLKAGDKVAITGSYLIDSEAQLSHGGESPLRPAATLAAPAVPAIPPAQKQDLDMKDMKMR